MICCKKCSSEHYMKSGMIRGHQRYKCKNCGCQFTETKPRGVSKAMKNLAIVLYAHCGLSLSGIAKIFKVSVPAVLKWVRQAAAKIKEPVAPTETTTKLVQVDEMWHFVNGKKTKFGSGVPYVGYHVGLLGGFSVIVLTPH